MADRDHVWERIRAQAEESIAAEPTLVEYLSVAILDHDTLEGALSHNLSHQLGSTPFPAPKLETLLIEGFSFPEIRLVVRHDLEAIVSRDPAAHGCAIEPFLYYKGFHALEAYRVSHRLWSIGRKALALYLHHRIAEVFSVDIHPAARIGKGIFIDHANGVVIGETAVVGDNVSLLHEVTLGGTGKEQGDRHPKIGNGVLVGAGAKILGNVKIGEGAKIGAGSVVLMDVPAHVTVAGVPARVVGRPRTANPGLSMDQSIDIDAYVNKSYSSSML